MELLIEARCTPETNEGFPCCNLKIARPRSWLERVYLIAFCRSIGCYL